MALSPVAGTVVAIKLVWPFAVTGAQAVLVGVVVDEVDRGIG